MRKSLLADEIHLARERMKADAEFYSIRQVAEGNKLLLTPEFLELKRFEAIGRNSKIYYGPAIPNLIVEQPFTSISSPDTSSSKTILPGDVKKMASAIFDDVSKDQYME